MSDKELIKILEQVAAQSISVAEAALKIGRIQRDNKEKKQYDGGMPYYGSSSGCQY